MKSKKSILALLLLFSSISYADDGKGYKVLSESFISTPNSNAKIVHYDVALKPVKDAKLDLSGSATSYDATGKVNEYIKIESDHSITITNYTTEIQRYHYDFTLFCSSSYATYGKDIEINPQGYFTDSSHLYSTIQKQVAGTWKIQASTDIGGNDSYNRESSAVLIIK